MRTSVKASAVLICSFLISGAAHSQNAATFSARLDCGQFSSGKKNPPFTAPLQFSLENHELKAERQPNSASGKEMYRGTVDALGRIRLVGIHEGQNAWELHFSGQLSDKVPTVLKGHLKITSGVAGQRKCKITFLERPADLMEFFSR